jgi:uncharacterized protein (TIRG00374 family)
MGINLVTLLVGVVLLFAESEFYGTPFFALILFLIAVTLVFFALLMLLCVKERLTLRIIDALIRFVEYISRGKWKATTLRQEVVGAAKAFHGAMKEYAHAPKTLFIASFFQVTSWALSLSVFYFTFLSLGYSQISWSAILVISSIFVAVKSIPVGVPFEVGLPEITLTTLFVVFKVPVDISATATVLIRLLTLWLRFFIGFVAQQWIGIKAAFTRTNGETSVAQH